MTVVINHSVSVSAQLITGANCFLISFSDVVAICRPTLTFFLYTDTIDEVVVDVIDECVLIVALCYDFEWMCIILLGQVKPDDIKTIVKKGGKYTRLRIAIFGGIEDMI